jgi:hypothetical protein
MCLTYCPEKPKGIMSCVTHYHKETHMIKKNSKVGVLVFNNSGSKSISTIQHNYLYTAVMEHGLTPVPINEVKVEEFFSNFSACGRNCPEIKGNEPLENYVDPLMLPALQKYLAGQQIRFLIIVSASVIGLDEYFSAQMIDVNDKTIIASKYFRKKVMAPLCIGLSCAMGLGFVICPFLLLRNRQKAIYNLFDEFLNGVVSSS